MAGAPAPPPTPPGKPTAEVPHGRPWGLPVSSRHGTSSEESGQGTGGGRRPRPRPERTVGRGGAGRGVPEVHSLHVNLPSGLRERPRQARWKAPQQGPSHSTRLPGFSHSCGRQGCETRCEKPNSTRSPDPRGSGAPAEGREEGRRGRAPERLRRRPPAPHLTHVLLLGGRSSLRPFRRDGHFGLGFVRTLVWGLRGLVSGAIRDLGGRRRTTVHSGRQQPRQLPSHAAPPVSVTTHLPISCVQIR